MVDFCGSFVPCRNKGARSQVKLHRRAVIRDLANLHTGEPKGGRMGKSHWVRSVRPPMRVPGAVSSRVAIHDPSPNAKSLPCAILVHISPSPLP